MKERKKKHRKASSRSENKQLIHLSCVFIELIKVHHRNDRLSIENVDWNFHLVLMIVVPMMDEYKHLHQLSRDSDY